MRISFLLAFAATLTAGQSVAPRKDIPAIAQAAKGAVVSVIVSDKDGSPVAQGSGFLVSKDGRIVTNYHVIREGHSAIVKLPDGAFFVVDGMLAFDKTRDIAIIKAHGENFHTVPLGDSSRVQVGDEIVAIGNPLSLESTVSNGIVSGVRAIGEEGGKLLQITAPISPGSSGGPLFNMAGEVVGITSMYLIGGENLNFALPINDAKQLLVTKFPKMSDLPNESSAGGPSSAKFIANRQICLDGLIDTVEMPFREIGGEACQHFVLSLPISPEDAQMLEGHSPEDDELLLRMQVAFINATTFRALNEMKEPSEKTADLWPTMIGVTWSPFENMRDLFCSRHPRMYVFDLELNGTPTPPKPCSAQKSKK